VNGVDLFVASDLGLGLGIGIPVVVVVGGIVAGVGLRRRHSGSASGTVAAPPEAAPPKAAPAPSAPPKAAPAPSVEVAEPVAPPEPAAPEPLAPAEPVTYRSRLGKARGLLSGYLGSIRAKSRVDSATWDDLEEALIRADVGVKATDALLEDLRGRVRSGEITGPDALVEALKSDLVGMLANQDATLTVPDGAGEDTPVDVWLFVGVNGVGKTTTVGKVARRLSTDGSKVLLAAADTFRAAAGEQLETWASRTGADIVRGSEGGDPGSVVFDAVQRAASKGHAVVLADTAGRLHNKVNLIEELKKVRRVADRPPGHVTEVLLVLDATTGQNGLTQAKVFLEAVEVTGVVLTKLDGTAKGGIVVAIERELGLPVKLVGLGEGVDDLVDFDPAAFVDALF
jgi:fused signal recognition particle receptor